MSALDRIAPVSGRIVLRQRAVAADRPAVLEAIGVITVGSVADRFKSRVLARVLVRSQREDPVYAAVLGAGAAFLAAVPLREVVVGFPRAPRALRLIVGVELRPADGSTILSVEVRAAGRAQAAAARPLAPVLRRVLDAWLASVGSGAATPGAAGHSLGAATS
jgi:hypothetical protein